MSRRIVGMILALALSGVLLLGAAAPASAGFSIKRELRQQDRQLDQIQAKVNANAKALDVLTRKVRGISDTVGVGNINDSRNLYQMVVATYECVVNGCPSP